MERLEIPMASYLEVLREAVEHGDDGYTNHLLDDFIFADAVVYPKLKLVNDTWLEQQVSI